jgi:cyclic beta-1,2-glucan synthetase
MYRAGLEWILGFRLQGTRLVLSPCIPAAWPGFQIDFKYRSAHYTIQVENPHGVSRGIARAELDGQVLGCAETGITLTDDGANHILRVVLGDVPATSVSAA